MEILDPSVDLDAFFRRLAREERRILLLDYDGTLAPFRVERTEAVPYPGLRRRLEALLRAGHTRVAIISGRATEEVADLLGVEPCPEVWGSHGWERRLPDGTVEVGELPEGADRQMDAAAGEAESLGLEGRVERKPTGVAVHWRGLDEARTRELRSEVEARWGPLAEGSALELHGFDGGIELRAPGRDKGFAVDAILSEVSGDAVVAYLGDDWTDEDAFRALHGRGLRVLVRGELRPSEADVWLRPPDELFAFLDRWHESAGGEAASPSETGGSA